LGPLRANGIGGPEALASIPKTDCTFDHCGRCDFSDDPFIGLCLVLSGSGNHWSIGMGRTANLLNAKALGLNALYTLHDLQCAILRIAAEIDAQRSVTSSTEAGHAGGRPRAPCGTAGFGRHHEDASASPRLIH